MPITVQCECGRTLRVKDSMGGKKGRCPDCQGILEIPSPAGEAPKRTAPSRTAKKSAGPKVRKSKTNPREYDLGEPPEESPPPRVKKSRGGEYVLGDPPDDYEDEPPPPKPRRKRRRDEDSSEGLSIKRKRSKSSHRSAEGWSSYNSAQLGTIGGGILAMIGAAVWFFVGLANDIIFFYPPVLFVLGLAGVVRGMLGYED